MRASLGFVDRRIGGDSSARVRGHNRATNGVDSLLKRVPKLYRWHERTHGLAPILSNLTRAWHREHEAHNDDEADNEGRGPEPGMMKHHSMIAPPRHSSPR